MEGEIAARLAEEVRSSAGGLGECGLRDSVEGWPALSLEVSPLLLGSLSGGLRLEVRCAD